MAASRPPEGQSPAAPMTRRLLARVRDVMAGSDPAQSRLDRIVRIIAADMVAEVCSIYVRRTGRVLELFATEGLKPSAVHDTQLKFGEGIVGDVAASARPFALADAQSHPSFAFRPETGEEIYSSMLGVPVLRGGRVIGVIAVQNRTQRQYAEEEVETLQTVAMVLAELITGGDLISEQELRGEAAAADRPLRLEGHSLNNGLAIGEVVLHGTDLPIERYVAEDVGAELERLDAAFTEMHGALDELLGTETLAGGGEHRDVLETYRLIAEDAGWLSRIEEAVRTGLTAEAAVRKVQDDLRARMAQVTDPYLRERIYDLDDLAQRLTAHLMGVSLAHSSRPMPERAILFARALGPAQLLDYPRLAGLVLEEGSPTSHVAIIARALGIPVVGRIGAMEGRIAEGDPVIVDADNAQVLVRPGEEARRLFADSLKALEDQQAEYAALRDKPAVTADGVEIAVHINAGLLMEAQHLAETGAQGIGLYRTEVPFMVRAKMPGVDAQKRMYTRILDATDGKPVVFRTLDVGGDKVLPYLKALNEENPAMGWRAIRVSLDRPALLRQQLRAMIRAANGRPLSVMFPMIAEVPEFVDARALLDMELARETERGGAVPQELQVGAMLEVPGLAFQLPALFEHVDFISIGTNDLIQFLFASDRGNPKLADRYDPLSPLFLKFLKGIIEACDAAGVPVSVCGEMAGRPIEAMALVGLGLRRVSVNAAAVGPLKAMLAGLSAETISAYLTELLDSPEHSLRKALRTFTEENGLVI